MHMETNESVQNSEIPEVISAPVYSQVPTPGFHKLKYVALIIFVLIAGFAGGLFFSRNVSKAPDLQIDPSPSQTISPTPESDETKGWKTYMDSENGYRFKYPEYLNTQIQSKGETVWDAVYSERQDIHTAFMTLHSQKIPFDSLSVGDVISLNQYLKQSLVVGAIESDTKVQLNMKPAQKYTFSCEGADCYYHMIRFQTKDSHNELIFYGAGGGLIRKFDQILSTFEFTDSQ